MPYSRVIAPTRGAVRRSFNTATKTAATAETWQAFVESSLKGWLLALNMFGMVAHMVGVILCMVLGRQDLRLGLYKTHPFNSGNDTHPVLSREVVRDGAIYPVYHLAAFFGLSMAFHACISIMLFLQMQYPEVKFFQLYMRGLYRNIGPHRWIEYFFSASLMILIMSTVMGIRDVHILIAIVGAMATTMLFGYLTEVHSMDYIDEVDAKSAYSLWNTWQLRRRWTPWSWITRLQFHILGYLPYAVLWAIIFDQFRLNTAIVSDSLPEFVDVAVIGAFALFTGFGMVQLFLQVFEFGPSLYWLGEVFYVILSFTSKAQLGFLVLFNALVEGGLYDGVLQLNKNA